MEIKLGRSLGKTEIENSTVLLLLGDTLILICAVKSSYDLIKQWEQTSRSNTMKVETQDKQWKCSSIVTCIESAGFQICLTGRMNSYMSNIPLFHARITNFLHKQLLNESIPRKNRRLSHFNQKLLGALLMTSLVYHLVVQG